MNFKILSVTCVLLFAVGFTSGCAAQQTAISEEQVIEFAQRQVASGEFEEILNFENPEVQQLDELPEWVFYEDKATPGDGPYWQVTFSTDQDGLLGPIAVFLDSDGTLLGWLPRE